MATIISDAVVVATCELVELYMPSAQLPTAGPALAFPDRMNPPAVNPGTLFADRNGAIAPTRCLGTTASPPSSIAGCLSPPPYPGTRQPCAWNVDRWVIGLMSAFDAAATLTVVSPTDQEPSALTWIPVVTSLGILPMFPVRMSYWVVAQ